MLELIVRFLALVGLALLGVTTCHSETEPERSPAPVLEQVDNHSLDSFAG